MSSSQPQRTAFDLGDNELTVLQRCADLGGLDDGALRRLAELMDPWLYEGGQVLYTREDTPVERPIRIIVYGQVVVTQERQHARGQAVVRRTLVAGTLFGEECLGALLGGARDARSRYGAETVGQTLVLELRPEDLREIAGRRTPATAMFWAGRKNLLVSLLEDAGQMSALAPEIVTALAQTDELSKLHEEYLYALLEGAEILTRDPAEETPLLHAGAVPDAFFVVLSGTLWQRLPFGAGTPMAVGSDGVLAHVECIWREPLPYDVVARGRVTVVQITWARVRELLKLHPEFYRGLQRAGGGERVLRLEAHDTARVGADVILLEVDEHLERGPRLDGLANLLAWSTATHLYDRVVVIHMHLDSAPQPALDLCPRAQRGMYGDLQLRHRWLRVPPEADRLVSAVEAAIADLDDPAPDVVILDAARLPGPRRAHLADLSGLVKVAWLSDRRASVPPIHLLLCRAELVPVAILAPVAPPITPLMALAQASAAVELADDAGTLGSGQLERWSRVVRKAFTLRGDALPADARELGAALGRAARFVASRPAAARAAAEPPWPPQAVRIRLSPQLMEAIDRAADPGAPVTLHADSPACEGINRLSRAVTDRRVGVALGGGGAFGYVHIALLRRLAQVGVPVDAVSGSSFGALIAACYCARGEAGLSIIEDYGGALYAVLPFALLTTAGFAAAVDLALGSMDVNDLEIPCFPVTTEAHDGREHDVREGPLSEGVRASNSIPPFAPVIRRTRSGYLRLLDGGLVANVPVEVLRQEGMSLTIGSNPIPNPGRLPRLDPRPITPWLDHLLRQVNPLTRGLDTLRAPFMLVRAASESQRDVADVMFRATTRGIHSGAVHRAREIIEQAQAPPLERAIQLALSEWRSRLRNPPDLIRLDEEARRLELRQPLAFRDSLDGERLTRESVAVVDELARWMEAHPEVDRLTVRARRTAWVDGRRARMRGTQVREQLVARGIGERLGPVEVAREEGEQFELEFRVRLLAAEAKERAQAEAQQAREEARAARLALDAEQALEAGEADLGRLLALEAAALEVSPRTQAVLRELVREPARSLGALDCETGRLRCVAWSPDGGRVAVGGDHGALTVWDAARQCASGAAVLSEGRGLLTAVSWSATGRYVAATGDDGRAHLLEVGADGGAPRVVRSEETGTGRPFGVAFSPDGRHVLAARPDGVMWFGAGPKGAVRELNHGGPVRAAAWSPDGRRVATAGEDGRVGVWTLGRTPKVTWLVPVGGAVRHLAWAAGGRRLGGASERLAAVWDLERPGEAPLRLEGHRRRVLHVAFSRSPSDGWLLTTGRDGAARVWSATTGSLLMVCTGHEAPVVGGAWHPRRDWVMTWSADGTARVWNPMTGLEEARLAGHAGGIWEAAWSPDGRQVATASENGTMRVWEADARLMPMYTGDHEPIARVEWAPGEAAGPALASGEYGVVNLWDPADGTVVRRLVEGDGRRSWATWSPAGTHVAVARAGASRVSLWETPRPWGDGEGGRGEPPAGWAAWDEGAARTELEVAGSGEARCAFSGDGKLLAVGSVGGLAIFDVKTGEALGTLSDARPDTVRDLDWQPGSHRLAVAYFGEAGARFARIWDVDRPGERPVELKGHTDGVRDLEWSPDGGLIATACDDNRMRVFETSRGKLVWVLSQKATIRAVAFSPDGGLLAIGDSERRVHLRRVGDWSEHMTEEGHGQHVTELRFSPDGSRLVSGSADGQLRLWNTREGRLEAQLESHRDAVRSIAWSPDGRWVVTAADDGRARVHAARFDDLVRLVGESTIKRAMTREEWARAMGPELPWRPTWPRPALPQADPAAKPDAPAARGVA